MTKKRVLKLLQLTVTILLLSYLLSRWGYSLQMLTADFQEPMWLIPAVLLALFITPLLAGCRWQLVLKAVGINMPLWELIKINFLSIFWGVILPSSDGYAFIRMGLVAAKQKVDKEKAVGSVILEKYFGILILLMTAFIGSFCFVYPQLMKVRYITGSLLLIMLGGIILAAIIPATLKTTAGSGIFYKILQLFKKLLYSWKHADKGKLTLSLLFILMVQMMSYLTAYFLFRFLGYEISFIQHLCLIPAIQIISLIPVTISGFGIREGAYVYFYAESGIPAASLITLSVLSFLIQAGIPALTGGILSLITNAQKD